MKKLEQSPMTELAKQEKKGNVPKKKDLPNRCLGKLDSTRRYLGTLAYTREDSRKEKRSSLARWNSLGSSPQLGEARLRSGMLVEHRGCSHVHSSREVRQSSPTLEISRGSSPLLRDVCQRSWMPRRHRRSRLSLFLFLSQS